MTKYLIAAFLFALTPLANADLGFPRVAFDNDGVTSYDAEGRTFTVDATPLAIQLEDGGIPIFFADGNLAIEIVLDPLVQPISGSITVSGVVDLGSLGSFSGELMTGTIDTFEPTDTGISTDLYDISFVPTGGQLLFALGGNNIGIELTSEGSDFVGDFDSNFGGGAKGTLGPVVVGDCDDDDDSDDDSSSDDDSHSDDDSSSDDDSHSDDDSSSDDDSHSDDDSSSDDDSDSDDDSSSDDDSGDDDCQPPVPDDCDDDDDSSSDNDSGSDDDSHSDDDSDSDDDSSSDGNSDSDSCDTDDDSSSDDDSGSDDDSSSDDDSHSDDDSDSDDDHHDGDRDGHNKESGHERHTQLKDRS